MTSSNVITQFLLIVIAVVVVTSSASLEGDNDCDHESKDTTSQMVNEAEACMLNVTSPTTERTFLMVKPDGVQRGLIGEIIQRFEKRGYKLVAAKMIKVNEEFASLHYEDHKEKSYFSRLVKFISSGPVFPMVWEGVDIVKQTRMMMLGRKVPPRYTPGSIRGDYSMMENYLNVIHGSDSVESAKREIALWFNEDELVNYTLYVQQCLYESIS